MSSSSRNRYQSRLFKLIRKQSRFFSDLFGLRTRELKVATSWSVEVMLYPIYKLWQTTVEFSKKQLPSHEPENRSGSSQLKKNSSTQTPPSVDMVVLRVKKVVEHLQLERIQIERIQQGEVEFVDSAIIHNAAAIPVRGIASRISGSTSGASDVRQLVLVTANNEILDILTPQQQQKLQDLIITEIDNYWEARHLSEIEKPQPFLLKISRWFKKLTSGKSKSKTLAAASTDITPINIKQATNNHRSSFNSNKTLFAVDTSIARLESNTLVPVSHATLAFQKRTSQLVLFMKTKFAMFFNGKEKVPSKAQNSISPDAGETQSSQFQNLVQAALNYFFGKGNKNKINQLETANSYTSSLPGKVSDEEVDEISRTQINHQNVNHGKETAGTYARRTEPWLELHDIFSESETVQDPNSVTSFLVPEPEKPPAKNIFKKIVSIFQREEYSDPKRQYWVAKRKPVDTEEDFSQTELKADPTPTKDTSSAFRTVENLRQEEAHTQTSLGESLDRSFDATSRTVTSVAPDTSSGAIVHLPSKSSSNWDIEDNPDYLETEGKVVGYEKHPLERILHFLDSALLKLEDLFGRVVSMLCMLHRFLRKL